MLLAIVASTSAQSYKVNSGGTTEQPAPQKQNPQAQTGKQRTQTQTGERNLGWGSNIQTARLARAAESALKSGNYSSAVDFAQRATQSAPGDPQLWFLLGYAARLAGKSQLSIDAYNRGLQLKPSSLDGLSGLAQTYNRLGRRD